jgi:hypothetical protein
MQKLIKVVLIIVVFMIGFVALAYLNHERNGSGHGSFGVVIALAIGAGIKAIWNYRSDKPEKKETTDIEKLDKN